MIIAFTIATILATKLPQKNLEPTKEVGQTVQVIIKPAESLEQSVSAPLEELPTKEIESLPAAPTTVSVTILHPTSDNLYEAGQCTWYVKNRRPDVPNSWGDATTWFSRAQAQGWQVGLIPKAGAIGWEYGHVVYVEAVSSIAITISEMNYDYVPYHLRTRQALLTDFKYIY